MRRIGIDQKMLREGEILIGEGVVTVRLLDNQDHDRSHRHPPDRKGNSVRILRKRVPRRPSMTSDVDCQLQAPVKLSIIVCVWIDLLPIASNASYFIESS